MKAMIGLVALGLIGLSVISANAQAVSGCGQAAPTKAAVTAPADPAAVPAAQEITIKGKVNVVKGEDGAVKFIFINPAEGHGYKVDLVNGEGQTLADKAGKMVEVTGMDVNRALNVQTITVVE